MQRRPPKKFVPWTYTLGKQIADRIRAAGGLTLQDVTGYAPEAPPPTAHGTNPYAGILQDYLNQTRADAAAESAAQKGDMINAIRNYIVSYGAAPDFSQMGGLSKDAQDYFNQAWDQKTKDLAAKAEAEGISSHARMAHENDLEMRRIPALLAARGLLHGGQTTADFQEQAQNYKNSGYDMLSGLMSGITGSVQNFQEAERQRQRALAEAEMQMQMQLASQWGDSDFGQPSGPATQAARPQTMNQQIRAMIERYRNQNSFYGGQFRAPSRRYY